MRDIETARLGLHRSIESVPGFVAVYADARRNILEIRIEESAKLEAARQLPSTWGGYETIVDPVRKRARLSRDVEPMRAAVDAASFAAMLAALTFLLCAL